MHRFLSRQLRRLLSDSTAVPEEWQGFVDAVDLAYEQFDEDRDLLERSLELSSQELMEANSKLRTVLDDLQHVNNELESFSYSVSHDLRAPLRGIDGFSQALLEDYADQVDAQGKDYIRRIRAGSQRMGQLIDDLLSLSQVTRSDMTHQSVDLSSLAQEIATELQQREPEREVEVVIAERVVAQGDSRLLRVTLENLLGNAWKYTRNHATARIEFGMTQNEGKATYFVRDDGAGFDMSYAENLFGAFQRMHGVAEFEGTGIGLATVQRIIHRHGGRVWAEAAVEQGATFYFALN